MHYGSMSGEIPGRAQQPDHRGVKRPGSCWVAAEERDEDLDDLCGVAYRSLHVFTPWWNTVYPIEKIKEAAHADKGGRNGKILVAPNGAIERGRKR